MAIINGQTTAISCYLEEGRTDWTLVVSKICWFAAWVLIPVCLVKFVNQLSGPTAAFIALVVFLVLLRFVGFLNLFLLDEVVSRLFPTLRSVIRRGSVRVIDFRIVSDEGRQVSCILKGDLCGGLPREGDSLELQGRFLDGTFWVVRGRNLTTDSELSVRPLHSGLILMVTLCLLVIIVCYLCGNFDFALLSDSQKVGHLNLMNSYFF